jgi:hypothetical protein
MRKNRLTLIALSVAATMALALPAGAVIVAVPLPAPNVEGPDDRPVVTPGLRLNPPSLYRYPVIYPQMPVNRPCPPSQADACDLRIRRTDASARFGELPIRRVWSF